MNDYEIKIGNNIDVLKNMADNSIDAIITDPPYGLSFMNKKWDYDVPSVQFWMEVFRVLKPGGHVLSFGGTRTYHRMVVNMEDAGFEIRDQIMWLYGSGFPKSLNVGKAIDKLQGNEREVVGEYMAPDGRLRKGVKKDIMPNATEWDNEDRIQTKGQSEFEGWGTALKPANEPICLARKPLSEKSVAENVLKWRTGGLNIDGCRVGNESITIKGGGREDWGGKGLKANINIQSEGRFPANIILECICDDVIKGEKGKIVKGFRTKNEIYGGGKGTNVCETYGYTGDKGDIHTNPMCPCRLMDEQSGVSKSSPDNRKEKKATGDMFGTGKITNHNDKGGASRFFYQAKVSKKERNLGLEGFDEKTIHDDRNKYGIEKFNTQPKKNNHPTVKPINLMIYLCRLITPPGGVILDPFVGSGSTGIAALLEGYNFIGIEMDDDYAKIADARIKNYEKYRDLLK